MKCPWVAAAVFLSLFFPFAQAQTPVEMTAEPMHHLALENRYVRVFQVEVPARSATLMHRHRHDYIYVNLGASEVSNEVEGKSPVTLKQQDGETRFREGNFAHVTRNLAGAPFRNVTIELLQDEKYRASPAKWDEDRGLHILHGGTEDILFAKDGARVSEVELQTAGVDSGHQSVRPQLLVAVSDLLLRGDFGGKGSSNLEMKSGDVKWFAHGFSHDLINIAREGVRYVVVEFQ
jgi:hypothetical protein